VRGLKVGVISSLVQKAFTPVLIWYYESPANLVQLVTQADKMLPSCLRGWHNRLQYAVMQGSLDTAVKVALYRQFNNGWQNNFGGFDYGFHRKIPTTAAAALLSAPLSIAVEMAKNAYYADRTYPKELQKGYTGYFNALTRIPFEEGPYYLFKNTYPLFMKHTLGFFTLFLTFDWLIDKFSVMWRISDVPRYLLAAIAAGFSATLTSVFIYPFSNTTREMVEKWPKKDGVCPYDGSYRKALHYLWYSDFWNTAWPGMFKNFYWHHAPQWFITLLFSYKLGIFNYWRVDTFSGPGDNNNEDSFI